MSPEQFVKQFGWSTETFQAARESQFKCAYCGHSFFESVDAWTQFNVDHLRPGVPGDRDERVENKVVACWTCNKLKSNFDPGVVLPNGTKTDLIAAAKIFIEEARAKRCIKVDAMRQAVQKLLDGTFKTS